MFIVTDDLEIINFNQYQNLSVKGEDPGKGQLVLTAQDGSKRVIAEFADFQDAYQSLCGHPRCHCSRERHIIV